MQIRRDNLEDALLLYQFSRDIEDEFQWLAEKEPFASSLDYGSSLHTVQKLQKKQQVSFLLLFLRILYFIVTLNLYFSNRRWKLN